MYVICKTVCTRIGLLSDKQKDRLNTPHPAPNHSITRSDNWPPTPRLTAYHKADIQEPVLVV